MPHFLCVPATVTMCIHAKGEDADIVPLYGPTPSQKCSGMASIVKESRFYLPCTNLSTNRINHTCLCLPAEDLRGMKGCVGLGTTIVIKHSAQDCSMMGITAVSCSNCDASVGKWSAGAMSVELMISQATSHNHDTNHGANESLTYIPNDVICHF